MNKTIALFGASGGIGSALLDSYLEDSSTDQVYAFSRRPLQVTHPKLTHHPIDISDEGSIQTACDSIPDTQPLDEVLVATGVLQGDTFKPEKSSKQLDMASLETVFKLNTIGPSILLKYLLPKLRAKSPSKLAVFSARVGSISDNRLGGWYAYRASKAALNMIVKTAAIEQKRRHPEHCIISYHPGSVDTSLSKAFQKTCVESFKTPKEAAGYCRAVLDHLSPEQSGQIIAWDGAEIPS